MTINNQYLIFIFHLFKEVDKSGIKLRLGMLIHQTITKWTVQKMSKKLEVAFRIECRKHD